MNILITLFLIVSSFSVDAAELNPQMRLRKMSELLRQGLPPTKQDYTELKEALRENSQENFFKRKSEEYAASTAFSGFMKSNISELFWLNPATTHQPNAFNNLVDSVLKNNLSWDRLLTERSYTVTNKNEIGFYAALDPALEAFYQSGYMSYENYKKHISNRVPPPLDDNNNTTNPPPIDVIPVVFEPTNYQVGGVITTQRFTTRFRNTELNKGRTRSSAIFRIFLCDGMKAIIVKNDEERKELIRKYLERSKKQELVFQTLEEHTKDLHGTQRDCKKCHYKLDPVGQMFSNVVQAMPYTSLPGALVYTNESGTKVDIPLKGLGELGDALVKQPAYASCQADHFMKWFLGVDATESLSPSRRNDFVNAFNSLERKPQSYAAWITTQPEFYQIPPDVPRLPNSVKGLFAKCTECHNQFKKFPFGDNQEEHEYLIREITKHLDLTNDGTDDNQPPKPDMPPQEATFRLTESERLSVRQWVQAGAPDHKGQPTVGAP